MSFTGDLGGAKLTVLLDVRNPFSYLALAPAIDFASALAVEIDWLPLEVPPLRAPSRALGGTAKDGKDKRDFKDCKDQERGIRHRRTRARMIAREIDTYAAAQGLVIREPYRSDDPEAANLGWLWVRHHAADRLPDFLRELFRRYWRVELEPGDLDASAALVDAVVGNGAEFKSWAPDEGQGIANALAQELRDFGLFQVPAYVVENEVFYGRQHLPMIRWIIEGRVGRVPI